MSPAAPNTAPYLGRLVFSLIVIGLFFYICAPFVIPVSMGAIFAILFYPYMAKLERRKLGHTAAAALLTLAITFILILPLGYMVFMGAKVGLQQLGHFQTPQSDWVAEVVAHPRVKGVLDSVSTVFPIDTQELVSNAHDIVQAAAGKLAASFAELVGKLPAFSMALAVVLVSLFFFLRDGGQFVDSLRSYSFYTPKQTNRLIQTFGSMCRSVILATVASGAAQALIFLVAMLVFGAPKAVLISLIVFFASFVPLVGAAPVTFGVVVYQFLSDRPIAGVALGIVAVLITLVDNIIRPWVLKDAGNLHPLIAFISAFGGLQALGVTGVFLGPIIAAVFMVMLQILFKQEA
ncbi:MAG: AI-2E family transporter [Bacteriovoracia bacterium]